MRLAIPLASTLLAITPAYAAYNLVKEYKGQTFFDGWDFYNNHDNTTNGDVFYLDQAKASSSKLAYVNDAGNVIIKVDDQAFVPWNEKRNSVRIETKDYFPLGTVLIFDATHLPFGCSVWPSFWTKGPNWPDGGEIDIIEAVNQMGANQMAIHSSTGCTVSGADCSDGAGCTILDQNDKSYGPDFGSSGGGVWATQFDTTGINIWFWSRNDVPEAVSGATDTVDPTTWGTPTAAYSTESCDIEKFFTPQQLIIDITLCGDWAGVVYQDTCGGQENADKQPREQCYLNNVINEGANYADAYFEIGYLKAFSSQPLLSATVSGTETILTTPTTDANGPASTTGTNTGTNSGTNTEDGASNDDSNAASSVNARNCIAAVAAMMVSACTWAML
ncbi:concanavalin A-like lectin/glucanase domain-containing protein [Earliella scabrosa]|nr:concanavalin A-like lectin/glucanase domain-containing protein [Earliella scabrosa]